MNADMALVEPDRRAAVAVDDLVVAQLRHAREHRRPRAFSAREALLALQFEATFLHVVAAQLRDGKPIGEEDYERMVLSVQRINVIVDEAAG